MKESVTKKILETLSGMATTAAALSLAIVVSPYGASYNQLERKTREIEDSFYFAGEEALKKRNFYKLLYKLKSDGLIEKTNNKWAITRTGKMRLAKSERSLPREKYEKEKSRELIIVMFDIPEACSYKRQWLRKKLKELGFKMAQKSVWIGNTKIPRALMDDLENIDLLDHIDIFTVVKKGSIG